jgi:hypothetical protein
MLRADQINSIHQLHAEGWLLHRIGRHLHIDKRTINKYSILNSGQCAVPCKIRSIPP